MNETTIKILLVEDDELDQMAFKRMVEHEKLPYDCTVAGSLSKAQQILSGQEFDVIVSDYSIGDGTALDVLSIAKDIPVILVTGADDRETAVKVWRAGAFDYLTKDVEREYLKTIHKTINHAVKQHRMTKALDRKQRNLNAIFDAAPVGMLLVDENLTIMRVNKSIKEMTGKDYLEIIGRLPGSVLHCVNAFTGQTNRCGDSAMCASCPLRKAAAQALSSGQDCHGIEVQFVLNAGAEEIRPWFRVSAEPVDIDGQRCAIIALDDITSRKEAEAAVLASEERYRIIFEDAANSIVIHNGPRGEILDFNTKAHETLGYSREEFKKLCIVDIEAVKSPQELAEHIEKIMEQGSDSFETKQRTKTGEILDIRVTCKVISIGGKKFLQSIWNDVTAQKDVERKLRETMELKSQFISTVSHELRTPLACVKEAVEVVLEGVAGQINSKQKHFLDIVRRNIERLSALINEVLDFQRLESGRSKIEIKENDIREVVKTIEETMSLAARQKGLDFAVELDGSLSRAWFDSNKIIQLLTNLIANAIKFTPQGGSVTVSILRQGEEMIMRVRDTGMGIPKESLSKIFDSFYRVPRPGQEIQGSGLGLSITRKIVDLHYGRIEVESELDKGTTFTVFIPLDARTPKEFLSPQSDQTIEVSVAGNSAKL
jgi:PAS domain S-box-containing protein